MSKVDKWAIAIALSIAIAALIDVIVRQESLESNPKFRAYYEKCLKENKLRSNDCGYNARRLVELEERN